MIANGERLTRSIRWLQVYAAVVAPVLRVKLGLFVRSEVGNRRCDPNPCGVIVEDSDNRARILIGVLGAGGHSQS